MSTSKRTKEPQSNRGKLYTFLGIFLALAIAALLIWSSGILVRNADAVTIGGETFSVADVNFYYYSIRNEEANMASFYAQFGQAQGFDYTIADHLQMYDQTQTYADYFRNTALNQLQTVTLLNRQAAEEGYTLSPEAQQEYADTLAAVEAQITYASLMRGSSESAYLKALYGPNATKKMLRTVLEQQTLASDYAAHLSEGYSYQDADLEAYYQENAALFDSFSYRSVAISPVLPSEVDEETGEALEPTDEQFAAAMEEAEANAEAVAAQLRAGAGFSAAASPYVDETTRELLLDPTYNREEQVLGSELSLVFRDWLQEDGRAAGDVGVVEASDSYHVILLTERALDREARRDATVWSIIVTAETTETTDEDGNVSAAPTEAQLAAAYEEALALQSAWAESTDRSEDAFRALLPAAESSDPVETETGGETAQAAPADPAAPQLQMLDAVTRGNYGDAFDGFVFASGQTLHADAVIPMEEGDGTVSGYRLVYLADFGPILWEANAEDGLRARDYELWYAELQAQFPIVTLDGLAKVGVQ